MPARSLSGGPVRTSSAGRRVLSSSRPSGSARVTAIQWRRAARYRWASSRNRPRSPPERLRDCPSSVRVLMSSESSRSSVLATARAASASSRSTVARRSADRLMVSHAVNTTMGRRAATTSAIRCARTDARRASSPRASAGGALGVSLLLPAAWPAVPSDALNALGLTRSPARFHQSIPGRRARRCRGHPTRSENPTTALG